MRDSGAITRHELDRAYITFERSIDRLSSVLDDCVAKMERMNERFEKRVEILERDWRIRELELDNRLKKLEDDRVAREANKALVFKLVNKWPTSFFIGMIFLCGIISKIVNSPVIQGVTQDTSAVSITELKKGEENL